MKKKIKVHTRFTLTHSDHTTQAFAPGVHEVDPDIADHWYVQAHSDPALIDDDEASSSPDPDPTSPADPDDGKKTKRK